MPHIKSLNTEEVTALEEFEERMKNVLPANLYKDSSIFYRFLKARDFDVDKAEKMLRKNIIWRKAFQIDTMLEDYKQREVFQKYIGPNILGLDKDGDCIVYVSIGKMDSKEYLKCMKCHELVMHVIYVAEKTFSLTSGKHDIQVALIFDLEELTFSNTTAKTSIEIMLRLTNLAQDNYPERLKSVKVINAPSYYVIAFALIKAVMSSLMVKKIHIFNRNGWKEHLLELMDADVLPAFLGGNRTDPDGNQMCTTFMAHGGKPAAQYILSEEERYFKDMARVKTMTVPPMGKREVYMEVPESGSQIEWEIYSRGKDIRFGLSFRISDKDVQEILPEVMYLTTDGTEKGSYKCKSIGTYIAIFDNSYSWLSSKEVVYCLTVRKSSDQHT